MNLTTIYLVLVLSSLAIGRETYTWRRSAAEALTPLNPIGIRKTPVIEVPLLNPLYFRGLYKRQQCSISSDLPCSDGVHCCPADDYCRPDKCCPKASITCPDLNCYDPSAVCCSLTVGGGACRPGESCCLTDAGQKCCSEATGVCCSQANNCCKKDTKCCPGTCCPSGYTCGSNVGTCSKIQSDSVPVSTESIQLPSCPPETKVTTVTATTTQYTTKTTKPEEALEFTCFPITATNSVNATLELDTDCSLSYNPPPTTTAQPSARALQPREACEPTETVMMTSTIALTIAMTEIVVAESSEDSGFSCQPMTVTNSASDELSLDESCSLELSLATSSSTSINTPVHSTASSAPLQTTKASEAGLRGNAIRCISGVLFIYFMVVIVIAVII